MRGRRRRQAGPLDRRYLGSAAENWARAAVMVAHSGPTVDFGKGAASAGTLTPEARDPRQMHKHRQVLQANCSLIQLAEMRREEKAYFGQWRTRNIRISNARSLLQHYAVDEGLGNKGGSASHRIQVYKQFIKDLFYSEPEPGYDNYEY